MPFIPAGARSVLDVGCSDGLFAEFLQRQRPDLVVDGVEPDKITGTAASARVRTLYRGLFPEAVPDDVRYDCIAFLDCLEHIVEPWDVLRAAAGHLNPGGVVVASLPNIRYASALNTLLRKKDWPWEENGTFDRTHVRFFTEVSMRRLFEWSGYHVEASAPINEAGGLKARALAAVLGSDVLAMQFVVVGRPAESGQTQTF